MLTERVPQVPTVALNTQKREAPVLAYRSKKADTE